ncbi:metallophosphoesterase [Pseudarthrobacter sp. MDT3-26]|uniref:metallophosphoesterase family protein n=1 Tax=Pseudarthrobacter raffinosi TaxID=2953651 RepID=UPI00208ED038|nr:metallophosphoesterase family protein [Pseudarthrobacter sp. MDT3-26]MCO4263728.1 metallophosphoesterase [Pseudarthrobacter sp. MDT3-26]
MSDSVLAVFGDWHGDLGWSINAVKAAAREGAKTMVSVGDVGLDWPGPKRNRWEQRMNALLMELGATLIVSPGNHDNTSRIDLEEVQPDGLITWRTNIRVLPKGGRTVIEGLRIGGLGGALSVDRQFRVEGKSYWGDEQPTIEQAEKLMAGGGLDILIAHDVPMGVPVQGAFDLPADLVEEADRTRILLRDVIDRTGVPNVFAGHWHQRVTHELVHPGGHSTRVDVLDMEGSRGNAVLVWPGTAPLRIEPLIIRGR